MTAKPLTIEELKEMAGKPVYCPSEDLYGIVKYETLGQWADIPFLVGAWHDKERGVAVNFEWNIQERNLKCYKIGQEEDLKQTKEINTFERKQKAVKTLMDKGMSEKDIEQILSIPMVTDALEHGDDIEFIF